MSCAQASLSDAEIDDAVVVPLAQPMQYPRMNTDGSTPLPSAPVRGEGVGADVQKPSAAASMKGRKMVGHYKIIIVGESGLGKSTARDCLLHGLRKDPARLGETQSPDQKTLDIVTSAPIQIHTDSPREEIWLRIVDTPGYGDHMDINKDIGKIKHFIEAQFETLYDAKRATGRVDEMHHDSLVTCCLYFIAPHRLKDNDIEFMKEISKLLPIVPVIAKADTMTSQETTDFRKEVSEKMRQADIRLYDFERDPRIADKPDLPPFTLITDRSMKERVYAWGTCEMNNAAHSDFTLLKDLVIKEHLELMHQQAFECYEKHRKERDGNDWEVPWLRKMWRAGVGCIKKRAPCVPDLVQAEWMLVIQAVVVVILAIVRVPCVVEMVVAFFTTPNDGNRQPIPVCAQGTEMQGLTLPLACVLTGAFMAFNWWKWHVRESQLNQSKEHIGSKGDEAANACLLFKILFIMLVFAFLVVLVGHVAVGSAIRSDKLQLETCHATLSTDKHELQRKVDACLTEHDSLLASFQNLERESESKLQDAQKKRDECHADLKLQKIKRDECLDEGKNEKGRHDVLLQEANKKRDRCLDEMKEEKQRGLDESKKEKGRHDKLLQEANEKRDKCLDNLMNKKNCQVF